MKVGNKNKPALQVFFRLKVDLMCGWVFVSFFSVSFDEDHKKAIGILLKAMALSYPWMKTRHKMMLSRKTSGCNEDWYSLSNVVEI